MANGLLVASSLVPEKPAKRRNSSFEGAGHARLHFSYSRGKSRTFSRVVAVSLCPRCFCCFSACYVHRLTAGGAGHFPCSSRRLVPYAMLT